MKLALLTLLGTLILGFFLAATAMCLDTFPGNERVKKDLNKKLYYAIPCIFVAIALNLVAIFFFMLKDFL